jgi:hypothetical protein
LPAHCCKAVQNSVEELKDGGAHGEKADYSIEILLHYLGGAVAEFKGSL